MSGEGGVAGEGRLVDVLFLGIGYHGINKYVLRLDVGCFVWPTIIVDMWSLSFVPWGVMGLERFR